MILAIDTDLFKAAEVNRRCAEVLEEIANNLVDDYYVALDGAELEREYLEFYLETIKYPNAKEHPAIRILDHIFNGKREVKSITIPADRPEHVQKKIDEHKCVPVEPQLIGMGANSRRLGHLTILLPGPDVTAAELRERSLYTPAVLREFKNLMAPVKIEYVTDLVQVVIPFPNKKMQESPAHIHSHKFELLATLAIQNKYGCLNVHLNTPHQVKRKAGQVDVYVYERKGNPRRIWIGECKLRDEGNLDRWITYGEILKLRNKLKAVEEFEKTNPDCVGPPEVIGFMISNAKNMEDDAWQVAKKDGITFLRARLPKRWARKEEWLISKLESVPNPK